MIHYRLSVLIIICLSSLGYASLNASSARAFNSNIQHIAQGLNTDSSPSPEDSSYNQAMQAGYQANREKDYQAAQKHFEKALEARPNDIYAQQALQNIEFFLAKQSNPLSLINLALGIGLLVIIIGIALGLWFYSRRFSAYSQQKLDTDLLNSQKIDEFEKRPDEENYIIPESEAKIYSEPETEQPAKTELFNEPFVPQHNELEPQDYSEVVVENLETTTALPIQTTTRIASGDAVETLIGELQENDPKKRRQAIWKLAQKADSRAMKPLVDLMIDTDSQERSLILEALSQISTRTLKPMNHALTISLQDKNPQVRKNAIRDLTRIYELMSQISQLLCHAIDDSDQEVQDTAKWAINQLNTQIPPRLDIITGDNSAEVTVEESYSDTME